MHLVSENKMFGGWHKRFKHVSKSNNCEMTFAVFLPEQSSKESLPVLYWLSGLTCTDENVMQKSGIQKAAAKYGFVVVAPDTSPRGEDVANDEAYDLGQGAGFYVNATEEPWAANYKMYDYIVEELPKIIETNFNVSHQRVISGHSMGGHGAIMIGLKHPERYESISAFSPICNPARCPWGKKAFTAYLGDNQAKWLAYDSSELIKQAIVKKPILIDQGSSDEFYPGQLLPGNLLMAAKNNEYPVQYNLQEGYDHSYFFISSFIDEHLAFHAKALGRHQ
jgi:S-formylglutathione hydrolase